MEDVDTSQLTKALTEHQNTLIKLVLVIGALIGVWMIFSDHQSKVRDIHLKISLVQDKLDAITARESSSKALKDFNASLPKKLNEIELITIISNYAKAFHMSIVSLSPAESKDMGLYDLVNINLNAGADDYRSMMLFLKRIESSEYPLRIDAWSGNEGGDGRVTFSIVINAVIIHS